MPLHTDKEPVGTAVAFDRLDDAEVVSGSHSEAISESADALLVQAVHTQVGGLHDVVQSRSLVDDDPLSCKDHTTGPKPRNGFLQALMQRTTEKDVQQLGAPTNPKDRDARTDGMLERPKLELVARRVVASLDCRLFAVSRRIDVRPPA